ncbi:glycosyltransferase family 2 protein [Gynuella sp.]|uniref:glycosyltransferase family 2 protein n=1 Tax=Gynuella sp. TaxID=2969146 RepID=UPI003D09FED8
MKTAIIAIIKNEADCLLEWIAYHLVIGIDHFVIANNDSTDESANILKKLTKLGIVTTVDFPTRWNVKPQLPAYRKLLSICPEWVDLVAIIDADEYITLMDEDQTIQPLINRLFANPDTAAVAMQWACFGSAGQLFREEGMVIERFNRQSDPKFTANLNYKTIARKEAVSNFNNPHFVSLLSGQYVNTRGEPLNSKKEGVAQQLVWDHLRVNHYVTKSLEEFILGKSKRGSAVKRGKIKHKQYFLSHDRNEIPWSYPPELIKRVAQKKDELEEYCQSISSNVLTGYKRLMKQTKKILYSTSKSSKSLEKHGIFKWHLDSPSEENGLHRTLTSWMIKGWLQTTNSDTTVRIVLITPDQQECATALTIDRDDVVKVMQNNGMKSPQRRCGFTVELPGRYNKVDIYAEVNTTRVFLRTVILGPHPNVGQSSY